MLLDDSSRPFTEKLENTPGDLSDYVPEPQYIGAELKVVTPKVVPDSAEATKEYAEQAEAENKKIQAVYDKLKQQSPKLHVPEVMVIMGFSEQFEQTLNAATISFRNVITNKFISKGQDHFHYNPNDAFPTETLSILIANELGSFLARYPAATVKQAKQHVNSIDVSPALTAMIADESYYENNNLGKLYPRLNSNTASARLKTADTIVNNMKNNIRRVSDTDTGKPTFKIELSDVFQISDLSFEALIKSLKTPEVAAAPEPEAQSEVQPQS